MTRAEPAIADVPSASEERKEDGICRDEFDPPALGEALGAEAVKHSVRFFDTTRAFADAPDFPSLHHLTVGHPRPASHAAPCTVSRP
jgi:hypothetical protein